MPGFVTSIKYGSAGFMDSVTYANGVKTGYSHNDRFALTYLHTYNSSGDLIKQGYNYEPSGLVHSVNDDVSGYTNYSMTYKYDYLGRLAKFTSNVATDSFEYDKAGNRTLRRNGSTNYVYNYTSGTNRLASIQNEGWSFDYDSCGNVVKEMLASDTLFFEYDIYGRLTGYQNHEAINPQDPAPGDTVVDYFYAGAGDLRARKMVITYDAELQKAGPFINMDDEFSDLLINYDAYDQRRDIGDVYVRNSTDTFYLAIFPRAVDPTFSNSKFAVSIDNDRVLGSGRAQLPMDTMTIVPPDAYWEYCLYLNGPTSYGYYDTAGTPHMQPAGMSVFVSSRGLLDGTGSADTAYVIRILKSALPLDSILSINVFSFKPGYSNTDEYQNGGSSAFDVVPGDAASMKTGYAEMHDYVKDPDPNDTNPGNGYRVKVWDRIYLYDGLMPLVEYSCPAGGEYDHAPVRYVYGIPGATIRIETRETGSGRDTFFLHTDGLGSVRSMTNRSGTEVSHYHYDPFGNLIESTNDTTGSMRRFCGKDWDVEQSLVYMAARYYDPRFGRFTSPDPEPTTMSPYSYCLNNPVSLVDPTGHSASCTGGGYSLSYPRRNWMFVLSAHSHPWPKQLGPGDRSDNGLVYAIGLTYTDASGGDPFRNWWDDYRDYFSEDEIKMFELMYLWNRWYREPKKWEQGTYSTNKGTTVSFSILEEEKQKVIEEIMAEILANATNVEGDITIGFDMYGNPIKQHVTLADVLISVLSTSGPFYIGAISGSSTGSTMGAMSRDFAKGVEKGLYTGMFLQPNDIGETGNNKAWGTFMHETFHLYTKAYNNEYGKYPGHSRDPGCDLEKTTWMNWSPSFWRWKPYL